MKAIALLLAEQMELLDQLAVLRTVDARRYAGELVGQHRREEHHLFWDTDMALRHRREAEEEIRTLREKYEKNQTELFRLIGELG
jgi:hypothetical protein